MNIRVRILHEKMHQKKRTTSPADVSKRRLRLRPGRIEFPGIRVQVRVQVDVTERIHDVGTRGDHLPADVHLGPDIQPQGSMRLRQTQRLPDHSVQNGRLRLPHLERDARKRLRNRPGFAPGG